MIKYILKHEELQEKPIVLLDIGSSGEIHTKWKKISKHSICYAFDPDNREMEIITGSSKKFKKLFIFNKILSDEVGKKTFYLNKSPYCSSSLPSNTEKLQPYFEKNKFITERTVEFDTISLDVFIKKNEINYIDWYKTDTQGTDLKILKKLPEKILEKVLVIELEPGIMDAYKGEDKLWKIMQFFDKKEFYIPKMQVKGLMRVNELLVKKLFSGMSSFHNFAHRRTSFWCEISYLNTNLQALSKRDLLVQIMFALIYQEFGFALELVQTAKEKFDDNIFTVLEKKIRYKMLIHGLLWIPFRIINKIHEKYFTL